MEASGTAEDAVSQLHFNLVCIRLSHRGELRPAHRCGQALQLAEALADRTICWAIKRWRILPPTAIPLLLPSCCLFILPPSRSLYPWHLRTIHQTPSPPPLSSHSPSHRSRGDRDRDGCARALAICAAPGPAPDLAAVTVSSFATRLSFHLHLILALTASSTTHRLQLAENEHSSAGMFVLSFSWRHSF